MPLPVVGPAPRTIARPAGDMLIRVVENVLGTKRRRRSGEEIVRRALRQWLEFERH